MRGALPFFLYFAGIGLGYILVELSQMQRLIIFLGHPTYALSVVLFTLLLSSGLGSYSTQGVNSPGFARKALVRLVILLAVLALFGLLTPSVVRQFEAAATGVRITVAAGILFPLGLFMGMAFPLGMKLASARAELLTPWLFGINGALSVQGAILAVAIAMEAGISIAFWAGALSYVIAVAAFVWSASGGED